MTSKQPIHFRHLENKNLIPVLPYQDRWIKDKAPLKIAVWARQSGKSFAAALRATYKCLEKRTQYIVLSKGERQSRVFMEKVKSFCEALKRLRRLPEFAVLEDAEAKVLEVYFPSTGSRIIGLPANPDTARGYTGNIILDEFAFHADAEKIYAACFPMITRGYSIEVISTPNGTAGKFYEIAKAAGLAGEVPGARYQVPGKPATGTLTPDTRHLTPAVWSGHRVDIYDALREGLAVDLKVLRAGCDDEETWRQEYECEFISDAQNYLPLDLIASCVHEDATTEWNEVSGTRYQVPGKAAPPGLTPDTRHLTPELYLGIDIGRKRDLTIAWLFEKLGDVLWSRVLLTLKGVSFDQQEKAICDLIEGVRCQVPGASSSFSLTPETRQLTPAVRRVCVDQSGLGMMLAEHLVQKYGAVVEAIQFTAQLKERLAPLVKQAFEERRLRIPDNRDIRADLNSVKCYVTPAGNVRFDAEHSDRGHADRFWALAEVLLAASSPAPHFEEAAALVGSPVLAGFKEMVL